MTGSGTSGDAVSTTTTTVDAASITTSDASGSFQLAYSDWIDPSIGQPDVFALREITAKVSGGTGTFRNPTVVLRAKHG
jgi:hypothetical protein